ncbi:hypothetical protein [Streptomyces umbrinus]|uniref:hypothetical protein n=1 Tax=Streptomyces umbrinus TaxID=67370 RepID=UPI0034484283
MLHTITAPVAEFTGQVGGVWFANGTAETDNEGALAYFRRHGYGVTPLDDNTPPEPDGDAPPDAKTTEPNGPQAPKPAGRSRPPKG